VGERQKTAQSLGSKPVHRRIVPEEGDYREVAFIVSKMRDFPPIQTRGHNRCFANNAPFCAAKPFLAAFMISLKINQLVRSARLKRAPAFNNAPERTRGTSPSGSASFVFPKSASDQPLALHSVCAGDLCKAWNFEPPVGEIGRES
jgi:hypothetical protein